MSGGRFLAERHLIGALILMGFVPDNIKRRVKVAHFGDERHAAIYGEILKHERFDAVLLAGWLEQNGVEGPFALIGSMLDDVPLVDLMDTYAKRVVELSIVERAEALS
jgi:replicative DNA helicase